MTRERPVSQLEQEDLELVELLVVELEVPVLLSLDLLDLPGL